MKVKIKKTNSDGIVRLESSGDLKEVIINEDFLHPGDASIALCFRGASSSGILELSVDELEDLNKKIAPKLHLLKGVKVLKFEK